jgi:hypothetical protein
VYFDELHPRRKGNPVAQEYWNSAATSDPSLGADVFDLVVSLLPSTSSSQSALKIKLQAIGRRLRRNLRQDDWGPTRGDQTEALRQIGGTIDTLRSAFDVLSSEDVHCFCMQFKEAFLQQPPKSWADFMSLLEESADFCARASGSHIGFRSIATQAGYFVDYPARVDDNTQSAIFEACAGPNIEGPDCRRSTYAMEDIRDWLKQFAALHEKALTSLIAKRGPDKFYSLALAVSTLAELYTSETGLEVTHYLDSAEAPASRAGKFILAAILAMRPRDSELDTEFIGSLGKQASGWLSDAALTRRVSQALKIHVRDVVKPDRRGRKS